MSINRPAAILMCFTASVIVALSCSIIAGLLGETPSIRVAWGAAGFLGFGTLCLGALAQERGTAGELCTRGYGVMLGYRDDPERTAEVIDRAGWMRTGDLAVMRDDGYVRVVGRIKDMIIRGGENVYPREIEEFLHGHAKIADVQVVGVPDERYGEEILACVIPRDPADPPTPDEIRDFCRDRLAPPHKVPRRVEILTEFPMTVSGKVRKVELRERYAEGT